MPTSSSRPGKKRKRQHRRNEGGESSSAPSAGLHPRNPNAQELSEAIYMGGDSDEEMISPAVSASSARYNEGMEQEVETAAEVQIADRKGKKKKSKKKADADHLDI